MEWPLARLGDIVHRLTNGFVGATRGIYQEDGVPYLLARQVKNNILKFDHKTYVSNEFNIKNKKSILKEGDVLLVQSGHIGHSAVVPAKHEGHNCHAMIVMTPKDSLSGQYLSLYFSFLLLNGKIAEIRTGSTVPHLTCKLVKELQIPLPPIPEQKRMVALLDTVFADLEQTRAKTEQNLKNARELFGSYLQQVFSQIGEGCSLRSMSDKSMLLMIDGDRGKNYPKKSEFLTEGYCLFLSTKNVRPNGFLFDQTMFIDEGRDNLLRKGKLERNDVILTTRGTIGNLALYDDGIEFNNIRINSGMLILRPNTEMILPSYLFEIMRSGIVRKQIDEKVSGAAQPQLPVNTLNTFSFPVPSSLEDQKRIVDLIREAEVKINELSRVYTEKLASIDELKKSILQKAFSGELTATT